MIRELVDAHPTYGYRRMTALLNRRFRTNGEPLVNHKRVYRIMASSTLLLRQYTDKRINRAHDGIVRTLRSNTRWCSDGFEIHAWNGRDRTRRFRDGYLRSRNHGLVCEHRRSDR